MNINELGSGTGLIYVTELDGSFIFTGLTNDAQGVQAVKHHALTRSPVGYSVSANGDIEFDTIGINDTITSIQIDAVEQFDIASPIIVFAGVEVDAATAVALAINSYIPTSGANYKAVADGKIVRIEAPSSFGGSVNGDVIVLTIGTPASHTININNISGGSTGEETVSTVNGALYYLNATTGATEGSIVGAEDISRFIIKRGTEAQTPSTTISISGTSLLSLVRESHIEIVGVDSTGNKDLGYIDDSTYALHDIIILKNESNFIITPKDLSLITGNIKLNPTSFVMTNDDYILTLILVDDDTDGRVWKELWRTPQSVGADSITNLEIANLAVGTSEIKDLAVTTPKITLNAITQALMALLSVGTPELIDLAVTQAKLALLSVGRPQMILNSVDSTIIEDDSVITTKILDANVTLAKLEDSLKTELIVVPVSFEEAGVMGLIKVTIPYSCDVVGIDVAVTKLIEATDDATIIPKDHGGSAMVSGQIDLTGGAPLGNIFSSAPTGNNSFIAGEILSLETSKSTVGGLALVSVKITRT